MDRVLLLLCFVSTPDLQCAVQKKNTSERTNWTKRMIKEKNTRTVDPNTNILSLLIRNYAICGGARITNLFPFSKTTDRTPFHNLLPLHAQLEK